jgi:hypothetical protein
MGMDTFIMTYALAPVCCIDSWIFPTRVALLDVVVVVGTENPAKLKSMSVPTYLRLSTSRQQSSSTHHRERDRGKNGLICIEYVCVVRGRKCAMEGRTQGEMEGETPRIYPSTSEFMVFYDITTNQTNAVYGQMPSTVKSPTN